MASLCRDSSSGHYHIRFRPGLSDSEIMLLTALEPNDEANEGWGEMMDSGATDAALESRIAAVLELQAGNVCSTDVGSVCWWVEDRKASIWFGRLDPPVRGKADLAGKSLIWTVRDLFSIPQPAEPKRSKPKAARGQSSKRTKSKAEQSAAPAPDVRLIAVEAIDRFALNPRDELEFDDESLRELGEDLKHRQVQACVVRPGANGRFELIAGERRWRGARLVGLESLRCEVLDVDDAEALWMCGQENERRRDWSPIARARWYRDLKRLHQLTDAKLAKRVGLSQGQVTTTKNLLELPEDWQRRIISREMSPTVARLLIPWAKRRPQVLDQVATELRLPGSRAKTPREERPITVREMKDAVFAALRKCTRSLNKSTSWPRARDPAFSLTKAIRERLDVEKITLDTWFGPVSRAWNVEEWDRLQREAKKRKREKAEKQPDDDEPATGKGRAGSKPADSVNEHRIGTLTFDWQGELIAEALSNRHKHLAVRILLVIIDAVCYGDDELGADLAMLRNRTKTMVQPWELWDLLTEIDDAELYRTIVRLVKGWLGPAEGSSACLETAAEHLDKTLNRIGAVLGIDFATEWRPTEELLGCWPAADLRKFPNAPSEKVCAEKPELIAKLITEWKPGYLPKQVRKLLAAT